MSDKERADISFEIVEHLGVLNTSPTGWTKELNVVKWNGGNEKYDIRDWEPGYKRMGKGITLHSGEMMKLIEYCEGRFD